MLARALSSIHSFPTHPPPFPSQEVARRFFDFLTIFPVSLYVSRLLFTDAVAYLSPNVYQATVLSAGPYSPLPGNLRPLLPPVKHLVVPHPFRNIYTFGFGPSSRIRHPLPSQHRPLPPSCTLSFSATSRLQYVYESFNTPFLLKRTSGCCRFSPPTSSCLLFTAAPASLGLQCVSRTSLISRHLAWGGPPKP